MTQAKDKERRGKVKELGSYVTGSRKRIESEAGIRKGTAPKRSSISSLRRTGEKLPHPLLLVGNSHPYSLVKRVMHWIIKLRIR